MCENKYMIQSEGRGDGLMWKYGNQSSAEW